MRALAAEVDAHGAMPVLRRVHADAEQWQRLIAALATGDHDAIDLANRLKLATDGVSGNELWTALFQALGRDPAYVLEHAQPDFPLALLCLGRAMPLATYPAASRELAEVRQAVEAVGGDALLFRRDLCLATLRDGLSRVRRHFGVSASD